MMSDAYVCPTCGGVLEDRMIQMDFRYKGKLIVIEDIPSQVCVKCGEKLIAAAISKDIDKILASDEKPVRNMTVPVLPYRHIAQA
ncbi:MAG: YgiT-type zinc finger protein [Dehalococcoidia bacterium]|jgi:YgiT-type zinc finger domain-containing protein